MNQGKALIDDELTTCLLDNGAQLNFITPAYAQEQGMDIMSLDYLAREIGGPIPPIRGIGGIPVEPVGFVMMNVKVLCVQGYDEDQVAIDIWMILTCQSAWLSWALPLFTVLWK